MVRGTAAHQRACRAAKRPAFPRPAGRAPSGCSWDKENGGWLRQDGSEWTPVRNEKRTLERAEKKARKKEKKEKAEREEATRVEQCKRRRDIGAYGEPFARWLAARRATAAMPFEEAWRSCDWAEEEAEARATLSPMSARASAAWVAAESGDDIRQAMRMAEAAWQRHAPGARRPPTLARSFYSPTRRLSLGRSAGRERGGGGCEGGGGGGGECGEGRGGGVREAASCPAVSRLW